VQSRYFEDSIQFATSSLWFASYGLTGLELDAEALSNGTISLIHARGIFPDGLPFNMPESDPLPAPRAVADHFPPTRDALTVALAIPPRKPNGFIARSSRAKPPHLRHGPGPPMRRRPALRGRIPHPARRETGADERPVSLGRKNFRLLFDTETSADLLTLPVARVVRDGSGHFAFDPAFVPPVLAISAARA